jgi:hypothetical protein
MIHLPIAKSDPKCMCVTGQYECWRCRKPKLDAIIARQTPKEAEYDRLAMGGWREDEDDGGCSCHISPPCSYCINHCADCSEHVDDCECFVRMPTT